MEYETLPSKKTQEIYKLINTLQKEKKIKIGVNQVIKAVNDSTALLVVIAKDSVPVCLVDPLPGLCEHRGVDYVFVESKTALGKACGIDVDALACAISVPKHEDSTPVSNQISKALK